MKKEPEVVEVDGESVEVIRTESLAVVPERMDLIALGQTDQHIKLFEQRAKNSKRMLAAALKITTPNQWKVFGNDDKKTLYATAGAADRVLRMGFGMKWGRKTITISSDDEALKVNCTAELLNPDGSVYEEFTGTRRGERNDDGSIKGYLKHEQDLIKGSIQNLKHTAVTDILGIRGMSPEDFKEVGLDLDKLDQVEFQDHASNVKIDELTVPFGRNKGKHPRELSDKSLGWYVEHAQKAVKDPAKAKWKVKNQQWLDAALSEQARRANSDKAPETAPEPEKEPKTEDPDELPQWEDNAGAEA